MAVVAFVAVPEGVDMVVNVRPAVWTGLFDMSIEVSVIFTMGNTFIDAFAGVITVLVDVVTEALTEVMIGALFGAVGVTIVVAAVKHCFDICRLSIILYGCAVVHCC